MLNLFRDKSVETIVDPGAKARELANLRAENIARVASIAGDQAAAKKARYLGELASDGVVRPRLAQLASDTARGNTDEMSMRAIAAAVPSAQAAQELPPVDQNPQA